MIVWFSWDGEAPVEIDLVISVEGMAQGAPFIEKGHSR